DRCGAPFYRAPSQMRGGPIFCSKKCTDRRGYLPPADNGDGTAHVTLSNGMVAIIDSEDIALVSPYKWYASHSKSGRHYARSGSSGKPIYMHRLILGIVGDSDKIADHRNRITLDNRKSNLRIASFFENNTNKARKRSSPSR